MPIKYSVVVSDAEDDKIKDRDIIVTIDYLSEGFDLTQIKMKHEVVQNKLQYLTGLDLIAATDCSKCNSINKFLYSNKEYKQRTIFKNKIRLAY